jgi:hypothetical protein
MEDETGQHKTENGGFLSFMLSDYVPEWGYSLHSEGRGQRFESSRVRQQLIY